MNKVTTVLTVTDRIEYLKTQIKAIEHRLKTMTIINKSINTEAKL